MVIRKDSYSDFISSEQKQIFASNVVPNNYSINASGEHEKPMSVPLQKMRETFEDESTEHISRKRKKKYLQSENASVIIPEDLEELKKVYKKCKSIIKKIESKYGHLLDIDNSVNINTAKNELLDKTPCQCASNKKIVFDENGTETEIESGPSEHICPKRSRYSQPQDTPNNSVIIDYYDKLNDLPDSLQELNLIMQNPNLEVEFRNKVTYKIRAVKQGIMNEMRYMRPALLDKLKKNMDEVIEFNGSNLSTMPGYVVN